MIKVFVEYVPGYFFDVMGRGVSFKRGIRTNLKPRINVHGYATYVIYQGKPRSFMAHRIVADLFLPKPDGCNVVNHKDGVKLNNFYKNLEWTTHRGNIQHAYDTGLTKNYGENNANSKLTSDDVKYIRSSSKGCRQLSRELGVSHTTISTIRRGIAWRRGQ